MKSLECIAIITTFLLGAGLSGISSAQHTLNPRSITQLSEVFDDATREWTYTIQDEYDREPSLSDAGLVFVTGDSDIIQTIDRDGTIVWEKRAPEGMATVSARASPDGRFVRLVHLRFETRGTLELLASDGQTLWTKDLINLPKIRFSRSGEYMLSAPVVFSPEPVAVFETRSGYELWRIDGRAVAIRDWGVDQLAYIENSTISSVAVTDGRTLWTHLFDVMFLRDWRGAVVWRLTPSEDGKKLVVAVRKIGATQIGGFDQTGNLLWKQNFDGAEVPLGITPDGRFLASKIHSNDNTQLKLIDVDTGAEIWTLHVNVYEQDVVIINDRLIFNTSKGVLVLTIDSKGRLLDQALLPQKSIEYVGLRNGPGSTQDRSLQKTVLMLMDTESERTFFIESIER